MDRPEMGVSVSRTVVPALEVRDSSECRRVTIPRHGHVSEPVIELIREGDVVRAIDITCTCGERYRLLCDYATTDAR